VQNFTIKGSGTVDGQGYNWWSSSEFYDIQVKIARKRNKVYVTSSLKFQTQIAHFVLMINSGRRRATPKIFQA